MEAFLCPLCCGRTFYSRKALKYHLLSEVEHVTCPVCQLSFDTVHELTAHLDVPCNDSTRPNIAIPKLEECIDNNSGCIGETEDLTNVSPVLSNQDMGTTDVTSNSANLESVSVLTTSEMTGNSDTAEVSTGNEDSFTIDGSLLDLSNSSAVHFCSSCSLQIDNVMEHIAAYHPNDTIYYEKEEENEGETVTEEVEEVEEIEEVDIETVFEESTILDEEVDVAYLEEEMPISETRKEDVTGSYANSSPTRMVVNKVNSDSTLLQDKTTHNPNMVIKIEPDLAENANIVRNIRNNCKVNFDNGLKLLPKELGLVQKYQMVDDKTGIPYTRKVIQIEKFWEKESFINAQSGLLKAQFENESTKSNLVKKRAYTPRKKSVEKEQQKKLNVESHLEDLFRSGALISVEHTMKKNVQNSSKKNKKYILKDGVFVEEESIVLGAELQEESDLTETHSSVTTIENVKVNFNEMSTDAVEGRTSILKFIQDDAGANMIPIYTCNKCGREYSSTRSFKSHKCKLPRVYASIVCTVCGYKCKNKTNLDKHIMTHDPGHLERLKVKKASKKILAVPVTCEVCNTEFTTENGLRMHKKMHRPDNLRKVAEMNNKVEFCCDLCNLVCYSERTFRIHYKIHFPEDREVNEISPRPFQVKDFSVGQLSCKLCSISFKTNDDLRVHWVAQHSVTSIPDETPTMDTVETALLATEDEDCFTCEQCGKVLGESVREQHATINCGQYKYTCSTGTCNRHFKSEEELRMHAQCHAADTNFSCSLCHVSFGDAVTLRTHMTLHATQAERPYPCGFCGRRFARPHEKVKHEWIHTGYQPYACKVCGMRFRVAYCLKTHERIHTGVRPYTCDHCGKSFRTCSGHRAHIRIHSDIRSFKCKLCYKTFKTPIQLAGHRKSHTKPYSCTVCSRRFANMFMLRTHTSRHTTHTESLKYKCHVCGASYGREYALKDHIKTHGRGIPRTPVEEVIEFEEEAEGEEEEEDEDVSQQSMGSDVSNSSQTC